VRRIVEQAAAAARVGGFAATIAVTDAEANVLGVFRMDAAAAVARVSGDPGAGLQGALLPSDRVAIAKAATGALLSSGGNAFSTRTASFIVQPHFPPGVDFTPGGPLFGVQFSSLPCGDFKRPGSPLGLAGDPGGLPLYREGRLVGGIGVEGDFVYGVDADPADLDAPPEESVALAGAAGLEAPDLIRASQILADGIRLAYTDAAAAPAGSGAVPGSWLVQPRAAPPSALVPATAGGVSGRADPRYPVRAGAILTAADVAALLDQAARQTSVTRAAIRQPLGSNARVSIAVVDASGAVLGFFQNDDAPNFGQDVSVPARARRCAGRGSRRTFPPICPSTAVSPTRRGRWASWRSLSSPRGSPGVRPAPSRSRSRPGAPSTRGCSSTSSTWPASARAARSRASPTESRSSPAGFRCGRTGGSPVPSA